MKKYAETPKAIIPITIILVTFPNILQGPSEFCPNDNAAFLNNMGKYKLEI